MNIGDLVEALQKHDPATPVQVVNSKNSDTRGSDMRSAFYAFLVGITLAMALYGSGALDNNYKWTASDMRGEYQRRMERLDAREAKAETEWELLRIQAERNELLAITEPYGDRK